MELANCATCKHKEMRYKDTLDLKPYCNHFNKFIPYGNMYYNYFCNGEKCYEPK